MQIATHPTSTAPPSASTSTPTPAPTATTSRTPSSTTLKRTTIAAQNDIQRMDLKLISSFRISGAASSLSRVRIALLGLIICCCAELPIRSVAVGYSYSRFVGPVSGPEHKVLVYDEQSGAAHVDYIAKPEYEFAYGIEDGPTQVLQNRKETRDGDAVKGVYSVVDPDGTLRVVKYTADNVNGFQAEIITNGEPSIHGHDEQPATADGVDSVIWQPLQALRPPRVHEHVVQHVVSNANAAAATGGDRVTAADEQQEEYDEAEDNDGDDDDDDDGDVAQQNLKMHNKYEGSDNESDDESEGGSKSANDDDDYDADSYEDALDEDEEEDDEYEESSKDAQSSETDSDDYY